MDPAGKQPSPGPTALTQRATLLLLARVVAFAVSIALPLLLVRYLSQHSFGIYKQVFLVVNSAMIYLPLGFGMTSFYFLVHEPDRQKATIFNTVLVLLAAGLLGALLFLTQPQLLTFLSNEPETAAYAPWISVIVVLWIMGSFLDIAALANQEIPLAAALLLVSQTTRTLLLIGAAIFFTTIYSLLAAAILQGALQCLLLFGYLSRRFPGFWRHPDVGLLREQLVYAVPLGVVNLIWIFQNDLHNYFVSNRFGAEVFAVYAVGCFQLPLINILHESASAVLIPQITLLRKENNPEEIISLTLRAMRKISAAGFPVYGFLLVTGPEFIRFLFTDRYTDSWPVFAINITLIPLSMILTDPIVRAYPEQHRRLVQIQILLLAVLIGSLWWTTGRFGMIGAIASTIGIVFIYRVYLLWLYGKKTLGFGRRHVAQLQDLGKLALAAGGAALLIVAVRLAVLGQPPVVVLMVCGVVYMVTYLGGLHWLRVATPQEVGYVRHLLSRPYEQFRTRFFA